MLGYCSPEIAVGIIPLLHMDISTAGITDIVRKCDAAALSWMETSVGHVENGVAGMGNHKGRALYRFFS